ncbi:histone deacetylase 18-like [Papaver somniferum]|uniref:histone deacetylase 18-like n=1 Tax=Papaver somniferum TaxID=3469 RepID=UPI000E6F63AB|nr:histone deacetylase 18-like [Papaver somniferum]
MRPAKFAAAEDIALVHTPEYINSIKHTCSLPDDDRNEYASKIFDDVYLTRKSYETALLAAGAVIEVAEKVVKKELDSAVALVRPPGHHAEAETAMGFCIFNNVAVATAVLLRKREELNLSRILIVDWDVHHGNGTQKMLLVSHKTSGSKLFGISLSFRISIPDTNMEEFNIKLHTYDPENFYPRNKDGSLSKIGVGTATGFNVNVPLEEPNYGNADYTAIWDHILIPVTMGFNPDLIFISGGFDAAEGDPLGDCTVTPDGFSMMLKKLMAFAGGKIVVTLEGGYSLEALSMSVCMSVEALLQGVPDEELTEDDASMKSSTWPLIERKIAILKTRLGATKKENVMLKDIFDRTAKQFLKLSSSGSGEQVE